MTEFATSRGRVRGTRIETPDGGAIAVLGIPTARVPARFRRSVPPDEWRGVRESEQGPLSWQGVGSSGVLPMDEESCLTVNVWVPEVPDTRPLPVLIWVHGGGHLAGSNADPLCDGSRMAAAHQVIVVAISYRLGVLGHLRLDHLLGEEYADAGNLALRDVVAGITWVRDEIAGFGGDAQRITLMGQSAGGVIVASLLAECGDDGLFQRAIIESATAERTHTLAQASEVTADLLVELAGTGADPGILLTTPAHELIAAQHSLASRWQRRRRGPATPFRPVVDGRFMHEVPLSRIATGAGSHIDVIVGTARNEATAYVDLLGLRDAEASTALDDELRSDGQVERKDSYLAACERDAGALPTPAEVLESYVTDREYRGPTSRLLDARLASPARTYAYLFAWSGADTATWARRAGHSLELPFVFRHLDDSDAARREVGPDAPRSLSTAMSARWASFVRSGDPDDSSGVTWSPFDTDRATIVFDERVHLVSDPSPARRRWVTDRTGAVGDQPNAGP